MMRKENSIRVSVILIATSLMCSIAGCNRTSAPTTEIAGAKTTENSEYTGRGNQNELLLALMIDLNENDTISLKDITLIKDAATQRSDVKAIKVYYTGQLDTLDTRTLHDALLLGKGSLSKKKTKIALSGDLKPGRNYLWVTADIADDATEGNRVAVSLTSVGYNKNKRFEYEPEPAKGREILLARRLLFAPGDYNSNFYRIPAIITAEDGSLVTATDKRKENLWDLPQDIDVVIRRSTDNGKTWSEPVTIAEGKGYGKGYGDAALVRLDNGKLLCLFGGMNGLWQSRPDSLLRTYVCESVDNGINWTSPRDITDQLYGAGCSDPIRKKWMASFCASGHAIQTSSGRVMVVAAVREGDDYSLNNYLFYSDDEGVTWHVSQRAMEGGDEAKVVELADGTILMSIRNKHKGSRYYTRSTDNGITWAPVQQWDDLKEPGCNGDMLRYSMEKNGTGKNILLHSIPFDEKLRRNVSVFVSYDEGETWPDGKTICSGASAYSALTVLQDGTIGAYIEEGEPGMNLVFLNFSLEWLTRKHK